MSNPYILLNCIQGNYPYFISGKWIMLKKIMIICLIGSSLVLLQAGNNQKIFDQQTDIYPDLRALYLEQGLAPPFPAYPWSEEEIRFYLDRIHTASLSKAGQRIYSRIQDTLKGDFDFFTSDNQAESSFLLFNSGVQLNLESYLHYAVTAPEGMQPEDYVWTHGYDQRLPLLAIPLELWLADHIYLYTIWEAREEYRAVDSPTTPEITGNHWNIFDFAVPYLDIYFPFEAYLSAGGKHWNLQLGRDQLSWGNSQVSNLALSDAAAYFEFLRFASFWDKLKFSSFYTVLEPYLPDQTKVDSLALMGHRLDLKFFSRINFAVNELLMVVDEPAWLLKGLNPVMIYHNWNNNDQGNSMLSLELTVNLWKYFSLYGQLAMDEFALKYETDRTGGGGPSAWAYLCGTEVMVPLLGRYLDISLEYAHTDPYFYHSSNAPYYYNVRRYWSLITDQFEYILHPLGHIMGMDAEGWFFEAAYTIGPYLSTLLEVDYITRGEQTVLAPYEPEGDEQTPTGTPEKSLVVHTNLENSTLSFLTTGIDLYWISLWNAGHITDARQDDFEFIWYVKYQMF